MKMQPSNENKEEPEGQIRRRSRFAKPRPNLLSKRTLHSTENSLENSPEATAYTRKPLEIQRPLGEKILNPLENKIEKITYDGGDAKDLSEGNGNHDAENNLLPSTEDKILEENTERLVSQENLRSEKTLTSTGQITSNTDIHNDVSKSPEKTKYSDSEVESPKKINNEELEGAPKRRTRFNKPRPNVLAKRLAPTIEDSHQSKTTTTLRKPDIQRPPSQNIDQIKNTAVDNSVVEKSHFQGNGKDVDHDTNHVTEHDEERIESLSCQNSINPNNIFPQIDQIITNVDKQNIADDPSKKKKEFDANDESFKNNKEEPESPVRKRVRFNKPRPNLLAKRTLPATENLHQPETTVGIKKPRDIQKVLSERIENQVENKEKNFSDDIDEDVAIEEIVEDDLLENAQITDNRKDKVSEERIEKGTSHEAFNQSKILSQNNTITTNTSKQKFTLKTSEKKEGTRRHYKIGKKNPPERSKMRMYDLIYWNPSNNPMQNEDGDAEENITQNENNEATEDNNQPSEEVEVAESDNAENEAMPVPQVKIGPDGQIILDEQSLVIETTAAAKSKVNDSPVVFEKSSNTTYTSFRKKRPAKFWSDNETMKFYKVLSSVGLDFSLMQNFFPKRTRRELKLKFKKEDKANKELIDKAISDRQEFNLSLLEDDNFNSDESNDFIPRRGRKNVVNVKKKATFSENSIPDNPDVDSVSVTKKKGRPQRKQARKRVQKRKLSYCSSDTDSSDEDLFDEEYENIPKSNSVSPTIANKPKPSENPLHFNLDNPTNSSEDQLSHSLQNKQDINKTTNVEINEPSQDVSHINLETEKDDNDSDVQSADSELEILKTVQRPTRSGRQPKRPEIFSIDDDEEKKIPKRKAKTRSVRSARVVTGASGPSGVTGASDELTNQLRNIILQKAPLVSSTRPSQDRLVFVPTSTADDNRQIIHVYMLSPCSQNNLPSSSAATLNSPLVGTPTVPTSVYSPVRTPLPSVGSNIQPQYQKIRIQPPMKFGQRIIISPISSSSGIRSPELQTNLIYPKSPPPTMRSNTRFQPNIAAAKRVRQTSTSSVETLDKEILELHINNNHVQETTQTEN